VRSMSALRESSFLVRHIPESSPNGGLFCLCKNGIQAVILSDHRDYYNSRVLG